MSVCPGVLGFEFCTCACDVLDPFRLCTLFSPETGLHLDLGIQ